MTPTFSDFFKSFYYSNTYVSPVDLSEQGIAKHLLASEDSETANQVQQLISDSEVQRVFSEPLSYDPEKIEENNEKSPIFDFQRPISQNFTWDFFLNR